MLPLGCTCISSLRRGRCRNSLMVPLIGPFAAGSRFVCGAKHYCTPAHAVTSNCAFPIGVCGRRPGALGSWNTAGRPRGRVGLQLCRVGLSPACHGDDRRCPGECQSGVSLARIEIRAAQVAHEGHFPECEDRGPVECRDRGTRPARRTLHARVPRHERLRR